MQVQDSGLRPSTGGFRRTLLRALFYLHFLLIAILTLSLFIRGLLFAVQSNRFHPKNWYPPVLVSTASSGITAFAWQSFTYCSPSKAIRTAFWFGPLLTCAVGILLLLVETPSSFATGLIALLFAVIQSLYGCWASPRFRYATRVLTVSIGSPPQRTTALVALSVTVGVLYSCFLMSGIGGATGTGTWFDILFILVILLSLTWTMHLIRNTLQVTIARVKYAQITHDLLIDTWASFQDALHYSIGSICTGSLLDPILGLIRGSARSLSLLAGDTDEFMFSCAKCYEGVASRLVIYGNRWGFVQVGAFGKGFVQASEDTWHMFNKVGMEQLIDLDLTGSFCFLSGVASGALCTIAGGSWALVAQKEYATTISIYTFLVGYLMTRIAMAWPQACVSAYHVAFAENPQNHRFDSTIPARMQELQRSQA